MDDYVVLVAHPAPFRKFPEPFLCFIGMSRYYTLDEDTYPSFLHDDGTEMDLSTFIHVVDPTKVKVGERERTEREARLLDSTIGRACGSGDSAARGGQDVETELVTRVSIIAAENVIVERPKRLRKKRQVVMDASGSSHPPKKLKGDYGTSGRVATRGKSPSVLKELLAISTLNVKVGVVVVTTLPLVTSLVSAMPEHESGVLTDSIIRINLHTIGVSERFIISSDSSHHSSTNASGAEGDSIIRSIVVPPMMTEVVVTSHAVNDPLVPKTGTKVTSPVHASMFYDSDSTETVKADITKYFLSERKKLESECEKQADLLKAKDDEVKNLKARLLLKETEAAEAAQLQSSVSAIDLELKDLNVVVSSLRSQKDGLVDQVHALETTCSGLYDQVLGYEQLKEQIKEFQDAQINIVNDKVAQLDVDLLEMALHLEEKFYPHILTTISGAISHTIEKGMQDGLSADIVHGKEGRSLADVAAYNHVAKANYNSALQRFCPLADVSGMSDLQPNVDKLMLHVHRSEDQMVLGETSLSFALSVTYSRVERIRENVAVKRSALIGVWPPLVDPLSAENLVGAAGTSNSVSATIATTTALSTTFASASSIPPIIIKDYEIVGTDGLENAQTNGQGNVASFPTVEFEKEELDTTLKRDLPN
uniref:Transposase (Putative), gypsy type n=1 Tax=Tanacetum cinerariifolium TaxID=118510 RepID=A0A6L2JP70_TANCI|nr:transposase (putative), gypsy type [Tanacetum cinerariifolium]